MNVTNMQWFVREMIAIYISRQMLVVDIMNEIKPYILLICNESMDGGNIDLSMVKKYASTPSTGE